MVSVTKLGGKKGLAAALLLATGPALAASNSAVAVATPHALRFGVRYERALNFVGGLEQVGVTASVPIVFHWHPFPTVRTVYLVQVAAGAYLNGSPDARPFLEVGPAVRFGGSSWFAGFGIAPTLIGGSEFRDNRTLGGSFFFTSHAAVGWRQGRWQLVLRFQHTSNANLDVPNPGVNMVGIAINARI